MKKYLIWIILGVLVLFSITSYNGLVGSRESVNKAWANVETQYQRRADLIPNLVNTVKGAADFEKSTLTAVMEARAQATSIRIDPNNITPEKLREFQAAQAQVGGALGRLLAVAENYPQLKAVESFNQLQAQLEGTENRITESRRQYNEAAQEYNASRTKFPRVIFASLFGFPMKPYFESDKGSEKAPEVKF
ncbi:MAG: LemA family protein [Bacteroidetes bacterium]|jgi:LemA protein|nr:LemA family protein [Bacteroidota bacterium]MBK8365639.1 LemA family protein [Bacteroidota bacterium]MBK9412336.1 LemA family protein [Bacteroidota bacterium]MBP6426296.1 LemA family protein [Bacteroidia bacterium]MBP6656666.1 LemA family protein [Bacteroidia bacterium]